MRVSSLPPMLVLLMLVAACASSGGTGTTRSTGNVITVEDLAQVQELTTLDAIRRLRPNWVRGRAVPTPAAMAAGGTLEPALRLDGVIRQGLAELQSIPVRDVQEIRFISSSDATTLYGTGYPSGIIDVRTRSR